MPGGVVGRENEACLPHYSPGPETLFSRDTIRTESLEGELNSDFLNTHGLPLTVWLRSSARHPKHQKGCKLDS